VKGKVFLLEGGAGVADALTDVAGFGAEEDVGDELAAIDLRNDAVLVSDLLFS